MPIPTPRTLENPILSAKKSTNEPAPEKEAAPVMQEEMEIVFNRGPGVFVHGDLVLKPNGQLRVPKSIASVWKKLSSGFVTSAADDKSKVEMATGQLKEAEARAAASEAKVAELTKRLAELEAAVSGRKKY